MDFAESENFSPSWQNDLTGSKNGGVADRSSLPPDFYGSCFRNRSDMIRITRKAKNGVCCTKKVKRFL